MLGLVTRLLSAHVRDPHVGRDVLVGVGVVVGLATSCTVAFPDGFGWTEPPPMLSVSLPLLGPRFTIAKEHVKPFRTAC